MTSQSRRHKTTGLSKASFMKRFITPLGLGTAASMAVLVAVVALANQRTAQSVEQAVTYNFAAANLLSKLQIQAERMRRYEKEMFIYGAVADKRAKYVTEFDDAHTKLLDLQNQAMASRHKGFTDADRAEVVKWAEATTFYTGEFRRAASTAANASTPEQKGELTIKLNNDIGPGKDRFRAVLDGASAMRDAKEKASIEIQGELKRSFDLLNWIVAGMAAAMSAVGFAVFARKKDTDATPDGAALQRSGQLARRAG
jgi:hypothetical protein